MPYLGGKLAPWFGNAPTHRALRRMADAGGIRLVELVAKHTPVDTSHLRESWKKKPIVILLDAEGRTIYRTGAETDVEYAPYVEWGTGLWGPKHAKYEIKPKLPGGVLHWIGPSGEDVFARRVMHPGSPGAHMMAIAVAELEVALPILMDPILHEWAREMENQNHSSLR